MNGARNGNFFGPAPWGPGDGSKGQISFNFNYKVNERYKTYQLGFFLFCRLGHAPGWDFGALGCPGSPKKKFKHGHMAY